MSDGIQLSSELVSDIKSALLKHDAGADNDMIYMQYLSAVTGYILAHQTNPGMDKNAFLDDVRVFMGQVLEQVESDLRPAPAQEDAFGVWKPGQA